MTFEIKIQTLVMLGSGGTLTVALVLLRANWDLQINMFVTYWSQKKELRI